MEVVNQPHEQSLGNLLQDVLVNKPINNYNTFYFVVAYVKRSGVIRLQPFIEKFRADGGRVKGVVGVDKNTSKQGLETLLPLCDELYVYHSESRLQTFHPKFYMFESSQKSIIFIGSSNLTAGGLYTNYEADAYFTYDLSVHAEKVKFQKFKDVFIKYSDVSSQLCKRLDTTLLSDLIAQNYLSDEARAIASSIRSIPPSTRRIFGSHTVRAPAVRRLVSSVITTPTRSIPASTLSFGFWKKLSHYDVSKTSSPGQIIIPLGLIDIFPPMSGLTATPKGAQQEDVEFNVFFSDATTNIQLDNVRAIHYVPAPSHARKNQELRFTFLNRRVNNLLQEDDILEFKRSSAPNVWFSIRLIKKGTSGYTTFGSAKYGEIH